MQTDVPFEGINFGDLPDEVDELLQAGVQACRTDRTAGDALFRQALAADSTALPTYFCLYKIHAYSGRLAEARGVAEAGLAEAARQAGWSPDWRRWQPIETSLSEPGRFALYTLKALAFIALRDRRPEDAAGMLAALARLDPRGHVGWPVVAELAEGCTS